MSNLTFAFFWLIAASVSIGVPLSLVHVLVNQ